MKALVRSLKLERVAVRCPIVLARSAGRATATSTNRLLKAASNRVGDFFCLILPAITGAVPAELLSIDTDWTVKAAKHVSFRRGSGGAGEMTVCNKNR